MQISLTQSLFRTLLIGILTAAVLIVASIWQSANELIEQNIDHDIEITQKVFYRLTKDRQVLINSVSNVLSKSYDFRRAVGTADRLSIETAFASYAKRIDTDVMALVDLDHKVIASHTELVRPGEHFPASTLLAGNNRQSDYFLIDDTLVHLSLYPVEIPTLRYYLIIGIKFDEKLLKDLKKLVDAEIIISSRHDNHLLTASLPLEDAKHILASDTSPSWIDVTFNQQHTYIVRPGSLPFMDALPVNITIASDVSETYRSFTHIQLSILVVTSIAIVIALGFSMLLARNVSRPVSNLVQAVNRVAEGEYGAVTNQNSNLKEISALATAVDSMQERIQQREQRISYQAQHDVLTGLFNRNYVEQYIEEQMQAQKTLQVVAITVTGFRTINDLYGYSNGDNAIRTIAERLLRWPGTSARLAGGEVLYITQTPLTAEQLETLKHIIEQPVETNFIAIPIKIAMAVVKCPEDANSSEELFRKMNIVSDEAIHTGHWCVHYRPDLEARYVRRLTITTELKRALASKQNELSMVYQPKIDVQTMKVCSMEALIRWNNANLGFIPPDEFITIAEQAGLIEQVTTWVMNQTISDLAYFRQQGYEFTVAMNLSTQDIQNKKLLDKLVRILAGAGLSPASLELEITESDLVADASLAIENLSSLTAQGFHFAIDDFGTGYSSLAYLKNLPVKTIKIDKSFILALANDKDDQQIVRAVLGLATAFDLKVVAEGVEDKDSLAMLQQWGCDVVQGYYISRPLDRSNLEEWLHSSPYSN